AERTLRAGERAAVALPFVQVQTGAQRPGLAVVFLPRHAGVAPQVRRLDVAAADVPRERHDARAGQRPAELQATRVGARPRFPEWSLRPLPARRLRAR